MKYFFLLMIVLFNIKIAFAHGVTCQTKTIENNMLRIFLTAGKDSEKKGIDVMYYYLTNGKILNIAYKLKNGDKLTPATIDFDLNAAIPPIKIDIFDIDNKDWVPFNDIKNIESKDYIKHLHTMGIINGRGDGTFGPKDNVTRAEFITMLINSLNIQVTGNLNNNYKDLASHWAKDTMLTASKNGLISGYKDGMIKPDNYITVAEVSAAVSKAFKFKTKRDGIYDKLKLNMWYSGFVKNMLDCEIISTGDSLYKGFDESAYINRGNCAMLISRALTTY